MKKFKVGLVGCGSIADLAHFPAYARMKDIAEVVACADIVVEKAKKAADKWGVPNYYASVEDLLAAHPDLDYIDICVWTAAHAPVAITCAQAGKNILCEKPLAATLEQGLAIEKAVKEAGVQFMLAVCTRYGNQQNKFVELRDQGAFGEIYLAKTAYVRRRGVPTGWFTNKAIAGGGPALDIGVHAIDRTWYLMGRPKPLTCTAEVSKRIGKYETAATYAWQGDENVTTNDDVFDVEDSAAAFFRFEGGKAMIAECSWTINGEEVNTSTLYGTKAGASFDPLVVHGENDEHHLFDEKYDVEANDFYEDEIRHFIDCVDSGKTPISPIDDAVTVLRMLDAIYRSGEAHAEVTI